MNVALLTTDRNGESAPQPQDFSIRGRVLSVHGLLFFALTAAVTVFFFTKFDINFKETWNTVRHVSIGFLILAFASYYLTFVLKGYRWRLLLDNAGVFNRLDDRRPSVAVHVRLTLIGWFANSISWFKLGDVYRAFLMSSQLQVGFPRVLGTVAAGRVMDLGTLMLLIVVAGVALLMSNADGSAGLIIITATGAAALFGTALLIIWRFGLAIALLMPARVRGAYVNFHQGTFGSFRQLSQTLALSGIIWLLTAIRLYLVIHALNFDVSLPVIAVAVLIPALLTGIPLTPGGLGFVEAGMSGLLILSPNLEWNAAVAIALVDRTITYWSALVVGGIVFAIPRVLATWQPLSRRPVEWPAQAGEGETEL